VAAAIHRAIFNHGIFFRILGRRFLRVLVIPLFSILLAVTMADAIVDWGTLRGRIESMAPWRTAALLAALVLVWCLGAGRALRPIWHQPVIACLIRQPLSPWRWVAYLTPSLALGLIPVAAIAWLAPQGVSGIAHYPGYLILAWPVLLGASFAGSDAWLTVFSATLVFFALVLAGLYLPLTAYAAPLVGIAQMRLAVTGIRRQAIHVNRPVYAPLSGSGIVATIARRDFRLLARTERERLLGLGLLTTLSAGMMLAFRINGGQEGREALLSACLLFTVAATTLYEILEAMKKGLGKEIMRRRWPVTTRQRAVALISLIGLLVGPAAVLILLSASTMGALHALVYLLFVAFLIAFTAGLFARLLVAQRSANGLYLLSITLHMVALLALPEWAYGLLAAALIASAFISIGRSFDRFTSITERISIGRLA
jgi:hypothetical protein